MALVRDDLTSQTPREVEAILEFRRFLALDLRPNGPRVEVPDEWIPYVTGTGPAPAAEVPA